MSQTASSVRLTIHAPVTPKGSSTFICCKGRASESLRNDSPSRSSGPSSLPARSTCQSASRRCWMRSRWLVHRSARVASALSGSARERAGQGLPWNGRFHHCDAKLPVPLLLAWSAVSRSRVRCEGRAFHRSRARRCRASPKPARRWASHAGRAAARL